MLADGITHRVGRRAFMYRQRAIGTDESRDLVDVKQRVPMGPRHPLVDLGHDVARACSGGQRGIDRCAQRAVAVAIGWRHLQQGDIEWNAAAGEE